MNGPNGTRIPCAIIHGAIVFPTNAELNFSGLTNSRGNISYKMLISRDASLGQYMVNVQTIAAANTHDNTPLEISTQNFIVVAKCSPDGIGQLFMSLPVHCVSGFLGSPKK
jgi:hypothetical protein